MADAKNYHQMACDDAAECAEYFLDTLIDQWVRDGRLSDDLHNDYPDGDSYHHETHVERSYHLSEAAELLDQLGEHLETDRGLWKGMEPREAISTQAAFTYGNAVVSEFRSLIEELNLALESVQAAVEDNPPLKWLVESRPLGGTLWITSDDEYSTEEEARAELADLEATEPEFVHRVRCEPDSDAIEESVGLAGKRFLSLYFALRDEPAETDTIATLIQTARTQSEEGDFTPALVLADAIEELADGVDQREAESIQCRAKAIRNAVA